MGAIGGGAVNLCKGIYNSPKGHMVAGGLEAVRREAPKIGGSFAVWGGLFSAFDCTLVAIRRKEDHWNPIFSGALTGGVLQLRYGISSAGRSAAFGGFLLAVIEGISLSCSLVSQHLLLQFPNLLMCFPQQLPKTQAWTAMRVLQLKVLRQLHPRSWRDIGVVSGQIS